MGSLAVILSALAGEWFAWWWADPIASLAIAGFIAYSAWPLLVQSVQKLGGRVPRSQAAAWLRLAAQVHQQQHAEPMPAPAGATSSVIKHARLLACVDGTHVPVLTVPASAATDSWLQAAQHLPASASFDSPVFRIAATPTTSAVA